MSKLPTVLVIFLLLSLFFTGAASAVNRPLSDSTPEQSAYTTIEIIIIIALIFIGIVALGYALHRRKRD